ncbi:PIN domain-containing protein [Sporomusa sp. KB1]|jgi:predicted nucleic acid-binding protein|uniref:PIN domain-containing protein n=1 Tax=Sporomusa sp. KB1 TaxID=943346 RepID=UPI0011A1FDFB|nr:PIN domain-containing protein [Sporomusa sp. KB1]TWH45013.1 putative nucleic acid-binding protein [Sporomusa sp. KB1]
MNEPQDLDTMLKSRIDTNIIIRFLVGDGGDHAGKARDLFKRATEGEESLVLCDTVFIETVFVLQSYYKHNRADIAKALIALIRLPGIETETETATLAQALEFYEIKGVDWADAIVAAKAKAADQPVYSFDNHFDKFRGVKRKQL